MPQAGLKTITIHMLLDKQSGNQAMEFRQLIEYKILNIFLEIHAQNVLETMRCKLAPEPFLKTQN